MASTAFSMPGTQGRGEGQRQDQLGESEEGVGEAHQGSLDPAADIARGGADDEARWGPPSPPRGR